jgi:hypothetical protein
MKLLGAFWRAIIKKWKVLTGHVRAFLARRPHRSFMRTRRRDYVRSLKLPGYWAFTGEVRAVLWKSKKLFLWLAVIYSVLTIALVSMASQDTYTQLSSTLKTSGGDLFSSGWGKISQAGLLLLSGITGNLSTAPNAAQQVYAVILALLVWLTTVWLLRALLAGHKPRLRDGIYNAGAPLVSSFLVALLLVVQLLPVAIAAIGYSAAVSSDLLSGGVEAMIFWTAAGLLTLLSLYWITSTIFALIIVTLPGMYPMKAIRTAGDIVIGRRLRILYRLLWLIGTVVVAWIIVMIPIILLATWINGIIAWLPIVPIALLLMSTLTIIWAAAYVYVFYRKVVDDDAAPA